MSVTVKGKVKCPHCNCEFEAEIEDDSGELVYTDQLDCMDCSHNPHA